MLVKSGIRVTAVHVNHMIRGDEAERDALFCAKRAAELGVDFVLFRKDVPALAASRGKGLEETAREERYRCFAEVMKKTGSPLLVTAHNADDNAETVLFNITRGCAAKGACGIPPVRPFPDGNGLIVRPALGISKSELLSYCEENGITFVTDSTNTDTSYSRNRIRREIIPVLKTINPGLLSSVSAFTDSIRTDCEYLDSLARDFAVAHPALYASELSSLPAPIAARVITLSARKAGAAPEKRHIDAVLSAVTEGRRIAVTLPGSIIARIGKAGLISFEYDDRTPKKHKSTEKDTSN